MSRTDIDPAALAKALRQMAGDGSIEWVCEPMQTRVLLDVADLLDENDRLQEQLDTAEHNQTRNAREYARLCHENDKLRELVRDMLRNMHGCTFHHSCGSCDYDECMYEKRARELGIEADE